MNVFATIWNKFIQTTKSTSLPGFEEESIYTICLFFIQEIRKGVITIQAKAVAFTFFLALFPYIIFLFTLIPYIPVDGMQHHILVLLQELLPTDVYALLDEKVIDIVGKKKGGLLSIGLFASIWLSTNGMMGVMDSFDQSAYLNTKRSRLEKRAVAFLLTVIVFFLLFFSLLLIVLGNQLLRFLLNEYHILNFFNFILFSTIKWMSIIVLFFTAVSFIYHYGPSYKDKWIVTSAGSSLATLLIISISLGFSYFVNNFGRFNEVYGSLGTVVVLLLYVYFNSFALLIGYELNVFIRKSKAESQ